jgi:hypothetical protein
MSPPFSCDLDSQFVMKRRHRDLRAFSGFDTSHSPIAASCRSMLHAGYADAHALRSASEMPDQPASRAHAIFGFIFCFYSFSFFYGQSRFVTVTFVQWRYVTSEVVYFPRVVTLPFPCRRSFLCGTDVAGEVWKPEPSSRLVSLQPTERPE